MVSKDRKPQQKPRGGPSPQPGWQPLETRSRRRPNHPGRFLDFPVVGIGASAGGLDALKRFLEAMPANSGMAIVIVQHLDPTHESLTSSLLSHHTSMPVAEATHLTSVRPDHVYVIPPNRYIALHKGSLRLSQPKEVRGLRMPIDFLLRSLAEEMQERAIALILSGTGCDGSLGLADIKEAGGMVMVQNPETAQFDGMPRSAVATGLVDYLLDIEHMPEMLIGYARHRYMQSANGYLWTQQETESLGEILAALRDQTNYDFRCYKKNTLIRRIERRMGLRNVAEASAYLELLRCDPDEVRALFKDLLIGVTAFFRNPSAFQALEEALVPRLLETRPPDRPIRVWVPGGSTGEEAYSIAMLLLDAPASAPQNPKVQIFATDVDEDALDIARAGVYPETIAAQISPERISRFFTRDGMHYRVNKRLREAVVFARQNLIADPPFSKMDLVSSRNLLIYLDPEVQKKLISIFHYALNPGGLLLLGESESIGQRDDLFEPLSRKLRLYCRRPGPAWRGEVGFPIFSPAGLSRVSPYAGPPGVAHREGLAKLVQGLLLEEYGPAAVLIDRRGKALYFHGPTDSYLEVPAGEPSLDLMSLARADLRAGLRAAVHKAGQTDGRESEVVARLKRGDEQVQVKVSVTPVRETPESDGLFLVTFEDEGAELGPVPLGTEPTEAEQGLVRRLKRELQVAREETQATAKRMEASNEELMASNEEALSMNEELHSANEELSTSKEIESLNEELTTMNSRLEEKISEVNAVNNDLVNLLQSNDIATVFLDADLRIRWVTPKAQELFNFLPTDVGRMLGDITRKFQDPDLMADASRVLDAPALVEKEVNAGDGRWLIRRVLPYRTEENGIDGVVVTLSDVSELKRTEAIVQEARAYSESIVETMREPLLVLDEGLRVISANSAFYQNFNIHPEETVGRQIYEIGERQWDIPKLRPMFQSVISRGERVIDSEVTLRFSKLGRRTILISMNRMGRGSELPWLILMTITDITGRKNDELRLADMIPAKQREIGRELHDNIGQQLTAFRLIAQSLFRYFKRESSDAAQSMNLLLTGIQKAQDDLRRLIHGILPVEVLGDDEGLSAALQELAVDSERISHIRCVFDGDQSVRLEDTNAKNQLLRIAQEAVTNAIRHARARRIEIGIRTKDGRVVLEIRDDGLGIPSLPELNVGMGVRIMRNRADSIGADFEIRRAAGGGTLVSCSLI